jgi:hypothetical protein
MKMLLMMLLILWRWLNVFFNDNLLMMIM